MGHRATSNNLLASSVATLSQKSTGENWHTGPSAYTWDLGVGQVISECISGLNGITCLPARSKQNLET